MADHLLSAALDYPNDHNIEQTPAYMVIVLIYLRHSPFLVQINIVAHGHLASLSN